MQIEINPTCCTEMATSQSTVTIVDSPDKDVFCQIVLLFNFSFCVRHPATVWDENQELAAVVGSTTGFSVVGPTVCSLRAVVKCGRSSPSPHPRRPALEELFKAPNGGW